MKHFIYTLLFCGIITTVSAQTTTPFLTLGEGNSTGDGTFIGVASYSTQPCPTKSFALEHHFYGHVNSSINFFRGGGMTGGFLTFNTNDNNERMRIDANGNVGIGTSNITDILNIHGPFLQSGIYEVPGIYFSTTNGTNSWGVAQITPFIASNNGGAGGYPGGLAFKTKNPDALPTSSPTTKMVIDANGNVGIGTTTPSTKLDVNGNLHLNVPGSSNLIDAMTVDVTSFGTNDNAGQSSFFRVRDIGAGNNIPFIIKGNGNVGIGTTIPDQKLTVKGKIHAEEVIVDLNVPVADYVFKPTYKLMSLHEVEQYVKENSHLPEIPSETEVKQNGLNMGEMQNKLLQKVEELTLYMIGQQKTIDQQQAQIKELNNKLSKLNKQ